MAWLVQVLLTKVHKSHPVFTACGGRGFAEWEWCMCMGLTLIRFTLNTTRILPSFFLRDMIKLQLGMLKTDNLLSGYPLIG